MSDSPVHLKIVDATIQQKPILAHLLELYSYDFSEFADFDIGDDGLYGYEHLPLYWTEPNRHPYLIYVDNKLVGFALVIKGSPISDRPETWDISEFFILKKYRRNGIGTLSALKLWEQLKGPWQIRILLSNKPACAFWLNALTKFLHVPPEKKTRNIKGKDWLIYKFSA